MTEEKSFEDLFPELKKQIYWIDAKEIICGGDGRTDDDYVECLKVEAHCLSKQRVKEAIDDNFLLNDNEAIRTHFTCGCCKRFVSKLIELKEELGLG